MTDNPLSCLSVNETGELVLAGGVDGAVHVLRLHEGLYEGTKAEKEQAGGMFERETRRERILESINKAKKIKVKSWILLNFLRDEKFSLEP